MKFDYLRLRNDSKYRQELTDWLPEDDVLREEGRLLCKTDLLCLAYVLGYTRIDPLIHREALDFFLPRDLRKPVGRQGENVKTRGTLLLPRGTFKTTLDEVDTVQECICFPLDCVTFILAGNLNLARAIVGNVAAHFVKPAHAAATLFQTLFPELCIPPSKVEGDRFTMAIRQTSPPIREAALMAFSNESGNSGWHCKRLKVDDIANNRNMKSETSQAEVSRNYGINRKMLDPGGIEDKLGTRYGPLDPYGVELTKSRPGSYRYVVQPALRLKSGGRLDANGFPPKEEMNLLFEALGLTYDFLRDEYDSDYSAFMTQYMNDAFGDNEVVFSQEEMLKALKGDHEIPMDGDLTIRVRLPNKGLGWGYAVGIAGLQQGNRMYIIDAIHGAYKPSVMANKLLDFVRKHDSHRLTIEDAPGAQKLGPVIENYALTLGYPLNITWAEYSADAGERDQRIKTLEPLLLQGRLILSDELLLIRKVFEQFTSYGMTGEDGFPDVISRVCEALPRSIANEAENLDAGLAFEMAQQRDFFNLAHGLGPYAAHEKEPDPDADRIDAPNPWGFEDIIPGLNA